MISLQNRYVQLSRNKFLGGLELEYLESLVEGVLLPDPEVFDSYAMSQVLSFADVRKPAATVSVADTYKLLL